MRNEAIFTFTFKEDLAKKIGGMESYFYAYILS